jgi:hypothetical protein
MDLTPPVAHTLGLLEAALRTLGPYSLTDGSVLVLDQAASAPFYQRFVLAKPSPTQLAVWVEVTTDGTSCYLDRSAELPEWSYAWIEQNPAAFQTEICLLFGSHTLVEHQGNRTILRLFGPTGEQVRQFTYTRGLGLFWFRQRHFTLYPPVFVAATGSQTQ